MKLTKSYGWMRRDFLFDAECEHCGNREEEISGYDDRNFYENVIPDMKCKQCGESTKSKNSDEVVLNKTPRHAESLVI